MEAVATNVPVVRVVIAAESASARFGGEAALPLHYFRCLRRRGIPAWLVVHERTRQELEALFPESREAMLFTPDTLWHRLLWRLSRWLPERVATFSLGFLMRLATQLTQRRLISRLVSQHGVSVIHQPVPVSPREPSLLFGLGAPVIVGPMNGGVDYPPAFAHMQGALQGLFVRFARGLADVMNWLMPGKRRAALLLVANERTRRALPANVATRVVELPENGVDLGLWRDPGPRAAGARDYARFIYLGRLIPLKAVDLLIAAFAQATRHARLELSIVGDGPERARLEAQARSLDIKFLGWLSQRECAEQLAQADALVLPSLHECGGAVVLEAMACAIPVIATAWGGPLDYLDASCGILVEPSSPGQFVEGLAAAMVRLANDPAERGAMGRAGRAKVLRHHDWDAKVERMLDLYREVLAPR